MNKKNSAWLWKSFENILRHACRNKQIKRVLEWGPGRSTEIIKRECPDASILTIEHQLKYFNRAVSELSGPNVEIVHRVISMKGGQSTGYVNYPVFRNMIEFGEVTPCYDLVFVDGRMRFDCLVAARQLVKDDGIVILHDSHRKNYHQGLHLYAHHIHFEEERTLVMSNSPLDWMIGAEKDQPNIVLSHDETIEELRERFESGNPFTYVRFGDADLYFMADPDFSKNRRHDPNPKMSKELRDSFMIDDSDYLIGCVAGGSVFKRKEEELKEIAGNFHSGRTYYSAVALHLMYVNDPDGFENFVRTCFHGKKVLLIGGESICQSDLVRRVFAVTATIEMSDRNAYRELDSRMPLIEKNMSGKFDIVISALGQATRVLSHRIWSKGYRVVYFDVGSTVDALAERHLRGWIKRHADKVQTYKERFAS